MMTTAIIVGAAYLSAVAAFRVMALGSAFNAHSPMTPQEWKIVKRASWTLSLR